MSWVKQFYLRFVQIGIFKNLAKAKLFLDSFKFNDSIYCFFILNRFFFIIIFRCNSEQECNATGNSGNDSEFHFQAFDWSVVTFHDLRFVKKGLLIICFGDRRSRNLFHKWGMFGKKWSGKWKLCSWIWCLL